nr:zinc finger protein 623-like [Penaeus vannamei]XP_027210700.1 zinc finger protein 623-like [Penaeus vannamei]
MERPRRNIKRPGALTDFLTVNESDRQSSGGEEAKGEFSEQDEAKESVASEDEGKLLLSPYKCGECKSRYRSKVALLRHLVKHSGEKPFECSQCGKGLSSQSALTEHLNIHTNNKPHRCDECGKESRQLSVHLRHLLTHQPNPELVYTCSVCAKTFKQNEYLRKHMRKHTGEKPFVCEECGKSFTCKSELNRHSQRHSSERPYTCSDCGQSFKMRHNLNKHQKAHTGTQQWKCLLCSAVFSKPKLLEAHRKTHLETVQHLQVMRPSDNTLVVSAEVDDRRKLPTVHSLHLPKNNADDADSEKAISKKLLRINDTTLPLEFILKSVGKGSAIKIKIIDKPAQARTAPYLTNENIVELMDEEEPEQKESEEENEVPVAADSTVEDGIEESMNKEAVEVSSVLSASASIVSHCLSKHYNLVNPGCEDYRCWLAMLTSLCQQLEPPYELEVCKHMSQISNALQLCLIQRPEPGVDQLSSLESAGLPQHLFCADISQYQFIYEQYLIILKTLQEHFNFIVDKDK